MRSWLLRGLVFAFGMVVVRMLQGVMINTWETHATTISVMLVVVYAIAVLLWGYIDGRADARAEPDPDRRGDLAMTWLLAGLFAGVLSAARWRGSSRCSTRRLYVAGLLNEITTFAAFTALLVFLMAAIGVATGRGIWDRSYDEEPPRAQSRRQPRPGHRRVRRGEGRRGDSGNVGEVLQRQQIALHTEPDDHSGCDGADVTVVPKLLARVHIRDVHLDQRCLQLGACVPQRDRRVRQRRRR